MIDAHCHLMDISKDSINPDFFKLEKIVNSAYCLNSSKNSVQMKKKYSNLVFSSMGISPQKSMIEISKEILEISSILDVESKYVDAIGEIGLDYHWGDNEEKRKFQKQSFISQIELAKEFQKPIIIHSRDAINECIDLLSKFEYDVMFHFYSGNVDEARKICDNDWFISIPPLKGRKRTEVIEKIEIENIVCETDAPYVGKTPLDVEKSIEIVSDIKQIDKKEVEKITSKNTLNIFQ
mgnify:CR=1 FL=1